LSQVLINLAGNAIKFTENGSVSIDITKVDNGICFTIVDTGIATQIHAFKTKWIMMGMTDTKYMAIEIEMLCRKNPENESIQNKIIALTKNIKHAMYELS